MFMEQYEQPEMDTDVRIVEFFAELALKQEPLGKEFEQVLHDNLWDLLVRT